MRIPIRARVTAAFAVVMLLLLTAIGVLAYVSMGNALLDEIDTGLRFRAESALHGAGGSEAPDPRLQEPHEAFEQVLTADGTVRRSTRQFTMPVLSPDEVASIHGPRFFQRVVAPVPGTARLLAVPLDRQGSRDVLVVGASMDDRTDALQGLTEVLLIGGPVAIALACTAAWVVAGWALRPMERMRRQAAAITMSGLDRRLTPPRARDELQALAGTLNDMLDRLARSLETERAFLERAGHELRTPLSALRTEVDLALRRTRTNDELTAALRSVSQETDRLVNLAEDLLVLARAQDGQLPLHRQQTSLRAMLDSAVASFAARAAEHEITLTVSGPDTSVAVDPLRMRQALVNLIDNALRHTPDRGAVRLAGATVDGRFRVAVSDTGTGFDDGAELTPVGLEQADPPHGHGLGLRIVHAVVTSHGGTIRIGRSDEGGAQVELHVPT